MFNQFEAADDSGLSIKRSVLKHLHKSNRGSSMCKLRSDINETGVYIINNWVTNLLKDTSLLIENISYDLVKLVVNNQFKKKLLKYKSQELSEIDEVLAGELNTYSAAIFVVEAKSNNYKSTNAGVSINAYIKDKPESI